MCRTDVDILSGILDFGKTGTHFQKSGKNALLFWHYLTKDLYYILQQIFR